MWPTLYSTRHCNLKWCHHCRVVLLFLLTWPKLLIRYDRPFHSCGPAKEYWCLWWVFGLVLSNYLSQRVQCIKSEHLPSQPLPVTKGVPQGSILGPTLFSIYINNIAQAVGSSLIHLYADDTVLYSAGPSLDFLLNALQQSFLSVQQAFSALNIILNISKTKVMWFGKKNAPLPHRSDYYL